MMKPAIYIPIIAMIILGLLGALYAKQNADIAKKANNETIMIVVQEMKEQRTEDKQESKEQKAEQQKTNDKLTEILQKLMFQMQILEMKTVSGTKKDEGN